jgi:hypothetical protein
MHTYTDGWHDGYRIAREDLAAALSEKANETNDEELVSYLDMLASWIENGEI